MYSAVIAASNEAARGRRRKINNERFCELCLTHENPKKEKGGIIWTERERRHQSIHHIRKVVVVIRKKNIKIKITYTSQQTRHEQICVDE